MADQSDDLDEAGRRILRLLQSEPDLTVRDIGERTGLSRSPVWTLLIIREALWGTSRFDDFQRRLGIARNVLTVRLKGLEVHGVMIRLPEGAIV